MSSWLENIKNQHGSLVEEEEEEEEVVEKKAPAPAEAKPEIQAKAPETVEKPQNTPQETKQNVKETKETKFKYQGPSTRETYLFATSFNKIESKQEKEYVQNLLSVRTNISNVLDSASKPLEEVGFLNKAAISAKNRYVNLRKSILSVPIPHKIATQAK